ncbi:MAG TPA: hypothetical protein VK928_03240, partial [Longimicrobiales bacterium]|nr:hypothetical protein [Longimicrobiales bacterium]
MRKGVIAGVAACAMMMAGTASLSAQQRDSAELARLRAQVDALAREMEALRLGQDVVPQADTSLYGFGPAAAKVYRVRQGVSLGGYGEVLYENFAKERENEATTGLPRDQVDALRAIVYVGYKFTDRLLFNSEIEFEHASTDQGGSVSVEFAYVDYQWKPALGVRGGMLLVPVGIVNELHEPPIFLGTTRSLTEGALIPTTWRENGFGIFGDVGDFSYRAYVVNGLDGIGNGPSRAGGFSAGGLRGGRQKGARALIEDPALVARVDFEPAMLGGLSLGGSAYRGGSGQGAVTATGTDIDATTTILEGHAQFKARGFDLTGLFATASVSDAELINQVRSFTGTASIGERLTGYYVQGGYDVLRFTNSAHELTPYVRYEVLNTQDEVPDGFAANPANDRTVLAIGAQWKPITNIVVKGDY